MPFLLFVKTTSHLPPLRGNGREKSLIFFGSFLYQDKKEHINVSLQYFPLAMQRFTLALWFMHSVLRYSNWITLAKILCQYGATLLKHERDSSHMLGMTNSLAYSVPLSCRAKSKHLFVLSTRF